jgi:small subunit ribosomal protein S16
VAVKLRLMRMGKKKQPTYRVVAADSRSPRDGRFIEIVGTYAPRGRSAADPDAIVEIDNTKALKWLRQGATPTERVEKLLKKSGAWGEYRPGEAGAPESSAPAAKAPDAKEPEDQPVEAK